MFLAFRVVFVQGLGLLGLGSASPGPISGSLCLKSHESIYFFPVGHKPQTFNQKSKIQLQSQNKTLR